MSLFLADRNLKLLVFTLTAVQFLVAVPVQCYQPYFYRDNWPMAPVVGCEIKFSFAQERGKIALISATRSTPNAASRDAPWCSRILQAALTAPHNKIVAL